ncbi:MAG: trehalose-phosphatase [Burkholderiales bacterium]|nr:trehalose-phosphatase [Burkholderiales bacterium]
MTAPRRLPPAARPDWAYFLDVDGTLIDIADTPEAVHVDGALLELIANLQRASAGALALVSGRALAFLDGRLGALRLPLAGQHGLERRDAAGRMWINAAPPAAKAAIKEALAPVLARHPGLLLEDKGLTLALHYRLAPQLAAYAHRLMNRLAAAADAGLEVQRGRRVAEIKPAGVDKGSAVAAYLTEPPFAGRRPVFIGDDRNDEHGFAAVNRLDGISVKVGKGASCARFRLQDVAAVRRWLGNALQDSD